MDNLCKLFTRFDTRILACIFALLVGAGLLPAPCVAVEDPIISLTGSDSSSLDNMLEVMRAGGMDVLQAMRIMIPPAWQTVVKSRFPMPSA